MPKIFIQAPATAYGTEARLTIAAELTQLGMTCEKLADTDKVRNGVWVVFQDVPTGNFFSGGGIAASPPTIITVYALKGGLDDASREMFITESAAIIGRHDRIGAGTTRLFTTIHEIDEHSWGMDGKTVSLAGLRAA